LRLKAHFEQGFNERLLAQLLREFHVLAFSRNFNRLGPGNLACLARTRVEARLPTRQLVIIRDSAACWTLSEEIGRGGRAVAGASGAHRRAREVPSSVASTARPWSVSRYRPACSRSTRPRTSRECAIALGTPALTQSVPDARQNSSTR